jgi:hypothetical protein
LKLSVAFKDAMFTTTPRAALMRPGRAREVEDQVDFVPAGAVPLLVGDLFELVEVLLSRKVEEHINPAESAQCQLNECSAISGICEAAWLHGDHSSTRTTDQFHGGLGAIDAQVAPDHRRPLTRIANGGCSAHAAPSAGNDAHLLCQAACQLTSPRPMADYPAFLDSGEEVPCSLRPGDSWCVTTTPPGG